MGFSFDNLEGCYAQPDPIAEYGYIVTFRFKKVIVTLRIIFSDENSGADMAITNMTTLPESERGRGCGSHALQLLLAWAKDHRLQHIQAVQVQDQSEKFWIQNSFLKIGNENNDFVLYLT
jgi:predicted GNAT family N-acyltransferase